MAVLAVLISGNVYVPVSCEQPSERRKLIHEKTDIHYVITTAEKEKQIEWPENVEIWCVEKLLENELLENYPKIYPEDSAYIIMTSGSTGQPKGVEMSHANAWNTIEYINRKYCVDQTDAILAVSALDFDLSVYDQFGLLSAGGKIILIPESESKNPDYWLKMIFEYHITRWNSVPILGEMLFECWKAQKKEKIPFRTAFYSGDWTLLYMVDMFYEAVEDGTLIVLGGTTETGIWSNEQIVKLPLPENWKTIPYGRPLENQAYRVVDDFGRDCPFWVEGELWIGGEGVGKGYRGDEVLTKQKYIMDCFGRWYRTGDNGCFWNDGTIEYRGRRDFQVKVKGHRIELGEIEAILNKIAGVKKSIVCAVEHNNRKNMLVAVVVKESPNINEEFLMQNLKSKLPVYMLPTKIIFEDKLPVGKNAKQDRKEVVRWIKAHEDRNIENEEKLTPCETRMLKIWKRLLGNDNITKKDNYFVCGGDSLLAVRMTAEIEAEFGVKVSIGIIFENNGTGKLKKELVNRDIVNSGCYILGAGVYPGLTGIAMNYLVKKYPSIKKWKGMAGSYEPIGAGAAEDLLYSCLYGFGIENAYWKHGQIKVPKRKEIEEIYIPQLQKTKNIALFLPDEILQIAKENDLETIRWYNILPNKEHMAIMKKAYQKLLQRNDIATEIQEFEEITRKSTEHWNIISFNSDDAEVGQILVKLEISNTSAYKMTGIVAALLAIRSAQTKRKSGIWNAYETIQMQYVFEKLQEEGVFIKETQEVSAVYEESEETGIL